MGRTKYDLTKIDEKEIPFYTDRRVRNIRSNLRKSHEKYCSIKQEMEANFENSCLCKLLEANGLTLTSKIWNDWLINFNQSTKELIRKAKELLEELDELYEKYGKYLIERKCIDNDKAIMEMRKLCSKIVEIKQEEANN